MNLIKVCSNILLVLELRQEKIILVSDDNNEAIKLLKNLGMNPYSLEPKIVSNTTKSYYVEIISKYDIVCFENLKKEINEKILQHKNNFDKIIIHIEHKFKKIIKKCDIYGCDNNNNNNINIVFFWY